jgi:hypothetical protein
MDAMKRCNKCGEEKPLDEMVKGKKHPLGVKPLCNKCRNIWIKNMRQNNPWFDEKLRINASKGSRKRRENPISREKDQRRARELYPNHREWFRKRDRLYSATKPQYRLSKNFSRLIGLALNGDKAGRHWETLVGYSLEDLKNHLEKHFSPGMTWKNYGEWHVDHKIPRSVFNFTSVNDLDFRRCWALKNLQPLWAKDNIAKLNRLKGPFQPCLKLSVNQG